MFGVLQNKNVLQSVPGIKSAGKSAKKTRTDIMIRNQAITVSQQIVHYKRHLNYYNQTTQLLAMTIHSLMCLTSCLVLSLRP